MSHRPKKVMERMEHVSVSFVLSFVVLVLSSCVVVVVVVVVGGRGGRGLFWRGGSIYHLFRLSIWDVNGSGNRNMKEVTGVVTSFIRPEGEWELCVVGCFFGQGWGSFFFVFPQYLFESLDRYSSPKKFRFCLPC
jgi:hypothetical protein